MRSPDHIMPRPLAYALSTLALAGAFWATARSVEAQPEEPTPVVGELSQSSNPLEGFDPAVLYWTPEIMRWSDKYEVQPQDVATLMQIESCGNPDAVSSSGALGLFQVVPRWHINTDAGESDDMLLDPEFNARKGLEYFAGLVKSTNSNFKIAYRGYNAGGSQMYTPLDELPQETQRYAQWMGMRNPEHRQEVLSAWYNAGGYSLCVDAHQALGLDAP